ncbi:MAG TPA: hypothetical protein VHX52_13720 [Steroidobacteraceae bacterium]|jgi:hypothetical protein|nr:hypothetical protein [Steroidobacteraceae bacterium]
MHTLHLRRLLPAAALASLCACAAFGVATPAGYNALLNTWTGDSIKDLVARWGQPDAVYRGPDGGAVLQYTRKSTNEADLQAGQPQFQAQQFTGAANPTVEMFKAAKREEEFQSVKTTHSCVTRFITDAAGVIRKWQWAGVSCRAVLPRDGHEWDADALPLVSPRSLSGSSSD